MGGEEGIEFLEHPRPRRFVLEQGDGSRFPIGRSAGGYQAGADPPFLDGNHPIAIRMDERASGTGRAAPRPVTSMLFARRMCPGTAFRTMSSHAAIRTRELQMFRARPGLPWRREGLRTTCFSVAHPSLARSYLTLASSITLGSLPRFNRPRANEAETARGGLPARDGAPRTRSRSARPGKRR